MAIKSSVNTLVIHVCAMRCYMNVVIQQFVVDLLSSSFCYVIAIENGHLTTSCLKPVDEIT